MDTTRIGRRGGGRWVRGVGIISALGASLTLAACLGAGVAGTGPVISEERPSGAITRIDAGMGVDVDVRFGTSPSVTVEAAQNLVPLVETRIDGDTLHVRPTTELAGPAPKVHLVVTDLEAISLDAGARATIDALEVDSLGVELSGGAVLEATGSATTLALDAAGGAVASLRDLVAATAVVDLGGGARADVHASDRIAGDVGGGASLTVIGDGQVDVSSSGGGSVQRG